VSEEIGDSLKEDSYRASLLLRYKLPFRHATEEEFKAVTESVNILSRLRYKRRGR